MLYYVLGPPPTLRPLDYSSKIIRTNFPSLIVTPGFIIAISLPDPLLLSLDPSVCVRLIYNSSIKF